MLLPLRARREDMRIDWSSYSAPGLHDELIGPGGGARVAGRALARYLTELGGEEIAVRQQAAELAIKAMGITFTVYHEQGGSIDRSWPLDIIPRTITRKEWTRIDAGLRQRVAAINRFIDDIYHDQRIIKDGILPLELIASSRNFRAQLHGHLTARALLGAYLRIGPDTWRRRTVYVLEDNLRVPSGVLLHDREPPGREACVPGVVRQRRDPAGG